MFTYDPKSEQIQHISYKSDIVPQARSDSQIVAMGNKIYLFGGSSTSVRPLNDLWFFDTESHTWTEVQSNPPPPRSAHCMVAVNSVLVIYGGAVWDGHRWSDTREDVYIFDTETGVWSKPIIKGKRHEGLIYVCGVVVGPLIWLVGGSGTREVTVLDTVNWTFSGENELVIQGEHGYQPRESITGGFVGDKLVLFGGVSTFPQSTVNYVDMRWMQRLRNCGINVTIQ